MATKIKVNEDAGFYIHWVGMEGMADGIENKGIKGTDSIMDGCDDEPNIAIFKYEKADRALARLRLCEFKKLVFKKLEKEFRIDRELITDIPTDMGQGGMYRGVKIKIIMIQRTERD